MSLILRNPGPGHCDEHCLKKSLSTLKKLFNGKPSEQKKSFTFTTSKIFLDPHHSYKNYQENCVDPQNEKTST